MKCISCDSKKFSKYSDKSYLKISVYQCEKCKLIVTGSSINEINSAISSIYSSKFWDEQKEVYGDINERFTDTISESKYRDFISQFKFCESFLKHKKKILEIGSGTGHTIFWLDQKGFQVIGIEPDLQNVSSINPKLKNSKVIHGYIDDYIDDFSDIEKYEIIWMSHVFEHLAEPDIFLEKIKDKMDENSVFFIEVPNCEHKSTLKDSIFGSPHVYHFTTKSISELCKRHNFEIIACKIFRPATKVEGIFNKLFGNFQKIFPYYPRIECDVNQGRDMRILLKKKN